MKIFEILKNIFNNNRNKLDAPRLNNNIEKPQENGNVSSQTNTSHRKFVKNVAAAVVASGIVMGVTGCGNGNTQSQDLTYEQATQAMLNEINNYDDLMEQYINEQLNPQQTTSSSLPPVTQEQLDEIEKAIKEYYRDVDKSIKNMGDSARKVDKEAPKVIYFAWMDESSIVTELKDIDEYIYKTDTEERTEETTDEFKKQEDELLKKACIIANSTEGYKSLYENTDTLNYVESIMPGYQNTIGEINDKTQKVKNYTFTTVKDKSGRNIIIKEPSKENPENDNKELIGAIIEYSDITDQNGNKSTAEEVIWLPEDLQSADTIGTWLESAARASERW